MEDGAVAGPSTAPDPPNAAAKGAPAVTVTVAKAAARQKAKQKTKKEAAAAKKKQQPPPLPPLMPPIPAELQSSEERKKCRLGLVIGDQIGSGSFAKVYKAYSCQRGKDVAVKIFKRSDIPDNYFNKFIVREIEVIKNLHHRNLVKFFDCQFTTKRIFLVMEYCSNGSLLDFLSTAGTLSEKLAREYFRDLVAALEYCHARGIVHRDIKCENLLFDHNYSLKLVDFGFARRFKKGDLLQTFCGSYAYASPEILKQRPYKPQPVDLWACGVVLYVMIFGKLPFRNARLKTLFKYERMRARDMDPKPRISPECQWMIMKILSPVEHRYNIKDIQNDPWLAQPEPDSGE